MAIPNVVALKQVVAQRETAPLKDVAKAINIKLRLADQNDNDARNHRIEAGEMLVTLRQRVEADGQDWWKFASDYFDRERKELEKLMTYVPAHKVAKAAIAAHPQKSDRAIAEEIGVDHKTVAKARARTGDHSPVEKRIGKDGKARKMPEPKQQHANPAQPEPRKLPKPPKIDMNVIKQAGAFHTELLNYTLEFCERIKSWHAEHPVDEESHGCVVQALETASMRLQLMAQEIDDR
ncbi:hypothetical protein IVB18_25845 [Bradyrhizobium sp. 186]|uniref:hypothetical protein n=1 Tax=Bradyrhizobium sp. 186 TaxID=2782654 RepID=UPI00200119F9|nr:hypothetical protein [Bradyrhizobium sp. 186]UPK31756.1 hypothetical protein IVB18_25845 [Bradyrhizobium sp. 186]